jgi:class 3 adenylate cyclase/tetratricopeptide (TPR) repeat protein
MADGRFTRQLATIVSVDAVGFSRLIGLDADQAVAAFEQRSRIILDTCRAFGGIPFGAAGDSVMAEFGLPVDALMAALEFQNAIIELNLADPEARRMAFRVGINTGDIIVRDASRYGDNVNIAARLQETAPENGIVISGTTLNHIRWMSTVRFCDRGQQDFKNILYPVQSYLVLGRDAAGPCPEDAAGNPANPVPTARSAMPAGTPTVAVLPFEVTEGGPEIGAMADGLAEDIISGLSNVRWMPVIAKSSSFHFRGTELSGAVAGRALGARYIVSGTIARQERTIIVKAMLEDIVDHRTLWAGHFEVFAEGLPMMPKEMGSEIVVALAKEVDRVEQSRAFHLPLENLDTWQLVRRGRWHMARRTRDDTDTALQFYERAERLSPQSPTVLNELSWWYFWRAWVRFGAGHDHSADLDRVVDYARGALAADPGDARPHCHLGIADIMRGEPAAAREHLAVALSINPSLSFASSAMGSAHLLLGEAAAAIPHFLQAEKLSPFDIYRFHNLGELAAAYAIVGKWRESADAAKASLDLSPAYWYSRFIRVGSLHRAGRHDEAAAELAAFRLRHPDFAIRRIEMVPYVDPGLNRFLIEGFRLAEAGALADQL